MKVGSITTDIIRNGLVFNMDAANRASTVPSTSTLKTFNTVDTAVSGSIVTDSTWEDGSPSSFDFDGTDGYINTNMDLSSYNSLSVEVWFKLSSNSGVRYLFAAGSSVSTKGEALGIAANNGQYSQFYTWDGNTSNYFTTGISQNEWSHILITQEGIIRKVYINGAFLTTISNAGSLNLDSNTDIGNWTGGGAEMNGNINNVHIYNRALSANEVLHNYNALKGRFGL